MGALTLVSAALSAAGAVAAARAESGAAGFRAEMAQRQAERERQIAARDAAGRRRDGSRDRAAERARLAGRGVSGEGTPLLLEAARAAEAELEAQEILDDGANRGVMREQQAELARARARNARRVGALRAGSTLLTGLGQPVFGSGGLRI